MKWCWIVLLISLVLTDSADICEEVFFSEKYDNATNSMTSFKNGNYIIQSLQVISNGGSCEKITNDGFLRILAVKYALERANKNFTKLFNVTLGWRFDDTCLSLPLAMFQGIKIINAHRNSECLKHHKQQCSNSVEIHRSPPIAVIGGYFSFTTVPLSNLFSLHDITQVSYGASTPLLSKTDIPRSFFRTIPPDTFQIEAMLDILDNFGWKYIYAVGSDDDYGKLSIAELKRKAISRGICIAGDDYIPFETEKTKSKAIEIVRKLRSQPKATVVIMFSYAKGMGEYILKEAELNGLSRIWLTSEAWNPEVFLVKELSDKQLQSIITVSLNNGPPLKEFLDYINSSVDNIQCDHWLQKFIEHNFNCRMERVSNGFLYGKNCTVSLNNVSNFLYHQNPSQINSLVDAVDAVIHAMTSLLSQCTNGTRANKTCTHFITPTMVTNAMKSVRFLTQRNRMIEFDESGSLAFIQFSIEQVQFSPSGKLVYVPIGRWTKQNISALRIEINDLKWPNWTFNSQPKSLCSLDCPPGQYQVGKRGCCWECRPCSVDTVSNYTNAENCIPCAVGYHTVDSYQCIKMQITFLGFDNAIAVTTVIISVTGIIITLVAFCVYIRLTLLSITIGIQKEPMITGFVLMLLSFLYFPFHIYEPTDILCQAQYAYFHLLLSLYNGLLMVQNQSVTRYISKFVNQTKESTQTTSNITFLTIQVIEIVFIAAWLKHDLVSSEDVDTRSSYFKQCVLEFTPMRIVAYVFPTAVLILSTTQSLSERHNSLVKLGKYLYYTCLALCIVNAAYIITLNYVVGEYQALVSLLTVLSYAFIYLCCIVSTCLFEAWTSLASQPKPCGRVFNFGFDTALHSIAKQASTPKAEKNCS